MGYGPFGMFGDYPGIVELTIQHWQRVGLFIGVYMIFYAIYWLIKLLDRS